MAQKIQFVHDKLTFAAFQLQSSFPDASQNVLQMFQVVLESGTVYHHIINVALAIFSLCLP